MHIKTITEEWVTHRGRGEGQLFPLSEHCSPLSTATFLGAPKEFHCPGALHQSLPP